MLIRTERRGHVLVISINREHKRNSIDRHTADQLDDALNTLDDDPELWVGVLTGTRTMFSAGSDVNANRHYHTDRGGEYGLIRRRRAKPLIAAVEGFALGGGMEIALACDMVVASATSRFGLPEVKIGVLPGSAGLFRAPRSLPVNLARQLILTGDPISAERGLELGLVNRVAEPGTAVVSFRGATILAPDDPRLAAVVAIDVGDKDLQQCADSVIRMHAEWRRAVGRGDVSYKSLSGFPMPYERYRRGERFVLAGKDLAWTGGGRPDDSRATFRGYLDNVFMWANTVGLARDAAKVPRADVRAGDFFVLGGAPGHAVMILDVAVAADGKKRALIGQGYMPAQSFHVIRAADGSPWFSLDGDEVKTPFWAPFPWESLRRLD